MTQPKTYLFVYGTLKQGQPAHHFLGDSKFVCRATTTGKLYTNGHYPMLKREGTALVWGEVYEVSPETLARCDAYEGVPHLYQRIIGDAWDVDEINVSMGVYMYEYVGNIIGGTEVPNGNF